MFLVVSYQFCCALDSTVISRPCARYKFYYCIELLDAEWTSFLQSSLCSLFLSSWLDEHPIASNMSCKQPYPVRFSSWSMTLNAPLRPCVIIFSKHSPERLIHIISTSACALSQTCTVFRIQWNIGQARTVITTDRAKII